MMAKRLLACASFAVLAAHAPAIAAQSVDANAAATWTFNPGYSASWMKQIGLTSAIETQANGGLGFVIGVVDTGIVATQMDVAGRVSPLSSCAAVTFKCPNGVLDDNGHGTNTASVAAGSVTASGAGMSGVAPRATILAEKVLNAQGSGYDTDVANGIVKAANAGAQVISLSLTYIPSPSIVSAINAATAKGDVIVFAGGNSNQALNGGANTNGLTAATLSHLVFVGSVNASNQKSSFSNTPGNGRAVAGTQSASYASLWLMAPGESIISPGIQFGANAFAYWTGTSEAAPMVSGTLALLESTWPVLSRNGTATQVLFKTATDLGAPGVDPVFGNGLLNVTKAFQPVGTLTVTASNGASVPIDKVTVTTLTGGAAGSLSSLAPVLANYTSFDSFQRNFTVDLSGLLKSAPNSTATAQTALTPASLTNTTHFADGRTLSVTMAANETFIANGLPGPDGLAMFASNESYARPNGAWMMTMSDNLGTEITAGHGFLASSAFAQALWGERSVAADAAYALQGTTDLTNIAQGGHFFAYGSAIGEDTRIGFTTSEAGMPDYLPAIGPLVPRSNAVSVGVETKLAPGWFGGMTVSYLDEKNALLGTQYTTGGTLDLGSEHRSTSVGLSTSLELWKGAGVLFNATLARTEGSQLGGLIAGTTPMLSRSYGMALVQEDLLASNDRFGLSVTKPLRVFDGAIDVVTTSVDGEGYAHTGTTPVAIHPDGNETDLAASYARFWGDANLSASLNYRQDADNLGGVKDFILRFGGSVRF